MPFNKTSSLKAIEQTSAKTFYVVTAENQTKVRANGAVWDSEGVKLNNEYFCKGFSTIFVRFNLFVIEVLESII
jgi:hypothetical protein